MSWLNDPVCPICGKPHVDGVNVVKDGEDLFLCLNCAEETLEKKSEDGE